MPKPQQSHKRTRTPRKPSPDTTKHETNTTDESRADSQPVDTTAAASEPKWLSAKPIELKPVDPQPLAGAGKPRLVKNKVPRAPEASMSAEAPKPVEPAKPAEAPKVAAAPKAAASKTAPKAAKPAKQPPVRRTPPPRKSTRVQAEAADYSPSAVSEPPAAAAPPPTPKEKPRATSAQRAPARKPAAAARKSAEPQVIEAEVIETPVAAAAAQTGPSADAPIVETQVVEAPAAAASVAEAAPVAEPIVADTVVSETTEPVPTTAVIPQPPVSTSAGGHGLRILMIASEAVPFAKTGGLADVAAALPVALGRLGHDVKLVLPRYRGVAVSGSPIASIDLLLGSERQQADIYEATLGPGARVWLVDAPALYDRDGIYGVNNVDHPDNPLRYAFLTRAAFETARTIGYTPDVVHAHDWQGGLAPVYLKTYYANDRMLGGVPSVFTIHNISYTGTFDPSWLPRLDLPWELFRPESVEYWSKISFLKAGINFAAKITTVSPTYAREILTPQFAYGFEGILQARSGDLVGILNGIDADVWNPATDPHIPTPYTADDLSGKRDAKRALLKAYSLPSDDEAMNEPLIGMVSRMVDQKGLDLIASVAHELPTLGARFVILGTGEPRYEEMWRSLTNQRPDRIGAKIGFDEPLSHLIEAGADLWLMPSHYEPSGLNQMYSLRYGTLPLVRATGGLDDTVENYDPYSGRGNGFKFWEASGPAMLNTLRWALRVYEHPDVWQRLQRRGMQQDFSWTHSAAEYVNLYNAVLTAAGRKPQAISGLGSVAGA